MLVEDLDLQEPRTVKPSMFFAFSIPAENKNNWQPIYH
jgi:hypothetical protein